MPSSDDLISVILPVRNGERFVAATLESVLAQTHRHLEVVIVDDGSTDGTPTILKAVAARDSRARVFLGPHAGVAAARNHAIAQARGPLIAPVDADDLWHPRKLERQYEAFRRGHDSIGVVYCWSIGIDENDFVISQGQCESVAAGRVLEVLAEINFLGNASTPLFRRTCVEEVGGYDSGLHAVRAQGAEDWKLYLAMAENCEFAVVPEYLVAYRRSSTSMSTDTTAMRQSMELVGEWIAERWPAIDARHRRRRDYFTNSYLADQALARNRVAESFRYQLRAYAARPARLAHPSTFNIFARLVARSACVRRPAWSKPMLRRLASPPRDAEAWVPARLADADAAVGRSTTAR